MAILKMLGRTLMAAYLLWVWVALCIGSIQGAG